MVIEFGCPVCDADIPLDNDEEPGDLIQCSYCKETFKLIKARDKLLLIEEFEE